MSDFQQFCTVIGLLVIVIGIPVFILITILKLLEHGDSLSRLWNNDAIDTEDIKALEDRIEKLEQLTKQGE